MMQRVARFGFVLIVGLMCLPSRSAQRQRPALRTWYGISTANC
jgi:hypothetical protein